MDHSARLEAENAGLRVELEAVLADKLAAESALATTADERGVCAAAANAQQALAAEEADRAREAGMRLLELADHAAIVSAAYEVRFRRREGLSLFPVHRCSTICASLHIQRIYPGMGVHMTLLCPEGQGKAERAAQLSSVLVWLQDEREGLRRELQATRERLAAAEAAVATASSGTALTVTTDHQLAILNHKLSAAR